MSLEFLVTALVVVLIPGTGVIYTLTHGVFLGTRASLAAAFGCTLGIIPHILASLLGLAALLHASAVAFQAVKLLGVVYLLYLAWGLWRDTGSLALDKPGVAADSTNAKGRRVRQFGAIALRGALINILNPKLSVFFLAFLPQFVPAAAPDALARMGLLSAVFMALTLLIFAGYGVAANAVRTHVLSSARVTRWTRRGFAAAFAGFAAKLALTER
ncbi:MAG: LysE family translocator [Alphaproteobacteria bacterium]|nr:LysE family translocator [Alphaproteobacteria bacterium]